MFLHQEASATLSIPVPVTKEEEEKQSDLKNKKVSVLQEELVALISSVISETERCAFGKEFKRAKTKESYLILYAKVIEHIETEVLQSVSVDFLVDIDEQTNE